ncbi:aminotransferase class III-fold pyridoxal phosphate-dependent enzyme [Burkholderia sp. TSV86]|uniref:aminotransferase class III-fold pyridoxal phosphate-dependent enzyme n=1 Tax=Burkholderia sp. TSV86 TaxID=1385594 RepID=UPI0009E71DFB
MNLRSRLLSSSRPLPDLDVERGEGAWLYCKGGRRFLDGSSGMLCANVGHSNPVVIAKVTEQLSRVSFAGPAVVRPYIQMELVDRLTKAVDRPDDYVAFTTSGTLGVEIAIAIARNIARVRGGKARRHVLSSNLSYHGASAYTLAIAGNGVRRPREDDAFGLGPAFQAPYPPAHTQNVAPGHVCDAGCADEVARAIDLRGSENVAAVILEPVNGTTGGAFVPPDGYLRRVAEICRERGVVLIHDEVLTGLWRTGKSLASHHFPGSSPDICILSKGLGAGYTSVSAILIAPELAQLLKSEGADPLPALGTMSATPLQAATCLGVLDELRHLSVDGFDQRCIWLGNRLKSLTEFSAVRDVRGIGFLYGIELQPGLLWPFMEKVEERGVFFYPFSYATGSGFTVAPPLNSSDSDLEYLVNAVRDSLAELNA